MPYIGDFSGRKLLLLLTKQSHIGDRNNNNNNNLVNALQQQQNDLECETRLLLLFSLGCETEQQQLR